MKDKHGVSNATNDSIVSLYKSGMKVADIVACGYDKKKVMAVIYRHNIKRYNRGKNMRNSCIQCGSSFLSVAVGTSCRRCVDKGIESSRFTYGFVGIRFLI